MKDDSSLCFCRYDVPLVADIHFQPQVAMMVADAFEKIRINPGNFADGRKTFEVINYDDPAQFRAEQEQIREVGPLDPFTAQSLRWHDCNVQVSSGLSASSKLCIGQSRSAINTVVVRHRNIEEAHLGLSVLAVRWSPCMILSPCHGPTGSTPALCNWRPHVPSLPCFLYIFEG